MSEMRGLPLGCDSFSFPYEDLRLKENFRPAMSDHGRVRPKQWMDNPSMFADVWRWLHPRMVEY